MSQTETIRAAAGYLAQFVETQAVHHRVPGVQVAIRSDDELVLDMAVGVADAVAGTPLRTDHLFRIASHSKTFAATSVMQLVEAGRIRLDDAIGQYVPELVEAGSPIAEATIRELLGHQSGVIRDGVHADFWQLAYPFPDRETLIADIVADGRVYARNEHFHYSNVGYSLLGLAIEAASGQTFDEYTRTHIIEPLGLTRTGAEYDPARADEYASGHTALLFGTHERQVIEHVDTRVMSAATGFYSTAAELTEYGAAHWFGDTRLLSDDSKRLMQRLESVVSSYGEEVGRYGVGMDVRKIGDRPLIGHSGGYPGHITRTYIDPKDKLVVSVLTNAVDGPATPIATALVKLIDAALTPRRGFTPPAPAGVLPPLESYTGRFANLWGLLDLTVLGGRLVALDPSSADPMEGFEELEVVGPDTLRVHPQTGFGSSGELIRLERAADGSIASVRVGGMTSWPVEEFLRRQPSMLRVTAAQVTA
ncbi:serine hydrolase domain-containing protein [Cellulomonas chengniuliangii]|uniref:Beta-lactamase family protein n=1 Tax=Cellulomonas chengniuliangii TaxID=2968084 RepID=A0ABY5L0Z7_9CELL|nr:serine hydrolase domain-containing protein [Cellulomonas chengniuliangii]MCC2307674.1 beta-lactamase family protein [Cellulomonas chengniuliangii]UUI75564.1 beta-lactamase family protein [Cellulomonas chengniuliangii]